MNYLILSFIVIGFSYLYEHLKNESSSKGIKWLFYIIICFILCLFAGLRTGYNDTWAYIYAFENTPNSFSSLFGGNFEISEVYLFKIWTYIIYHFVSHSPNVYLGLSAIVFVCPSVYLIQKYSKNFTFSIILFMFGGMYLFSLAGLKQAMATGIIMLALPYLFKKNYFMYYIFCVIALFTHAYSLFFLIVPLLGTEVFNIRTIVFSIAIVVVGLTLSSFTDIITTIADFLGKDLSETELDGSVNIFRAFVYLIPLIFTMFCYSKLNNIRKEEKVIVKIGLLSSLFMILALFGNPIFFGRIPQYFLIGIVISLPLLIRIIFNNKDQKTILTLATVCYIAYGIYGLYSDGAFERDIFQLLLFK